MFLRYTPNRTTVEGSIDKSFYLKSLPFSETGIKIKKWGVRSCVPNMIFEAEFEGDGLSGVKMRQKERTLFDMLSGQAPSNFYCNGNGTFTGKKFSISLELPKKWPNAPQNLELQFKTENGHFWSIDPMKDPFLKSEFKKCFDQVEITKKDVELKSLSLDVSQQPTKSPAASGAGNGNAKGAK